MTFSRESHVFRSGKMLSYEPRKSFMSLENAKRIYMLHGHPMCYTKKRTKELREK